MLKWSYWLSGVGYRVAMLYKLHLTDAEIDMPSLKSVEQL